jgi:ABC-type glycerol-3-phosphate transport system substrate-binding protein
MKKNLAILILGAAALLAACGGGDPPPPTSEVPASANDSIGDFIGYLQALVVSPADTLEPVDVSAVTPPTDETSPPQVVD